MIEAPPLFRLIGAMLVGIWLAATLVSLRGRLIRSDTGIRPPSRERRGPGSIASPEMSLTAEVFNLTSLPIWWVDQDGRLAGANEAYASAVGHPTAAGAVRDQAELAPGARGLATEARATDRAVVGEERVSVNGERRILEILAVPLKGGDVAHLALDETRRHAAHSEAATRARGLAEILDEMDAAAALFDGSGALRHHNSAFLQLFGLDGEWLETRPSLDRVLDAIRQADRLPETSNYVVWRDERRAWLTSDKTRIEERWALPGGTLLRSTILPRGGEGPLWIIDDETDRVQQQAAQDRLRAVQAAMLDCLEEGVAVFGPDGKLVSFNQRFAQVVIASPAELEAAPGADRLMERLSGLLNEPERAQRLRELIVGATAGRTGGHGRVTSALGFTVDYSAFPLPDGNALIVCNVIQDGE